MPQNPPPTRTAVVVTPRSELDTVQRYLPANYNAQTDGDIIVISGYDRAGWTLDGYVIPRLSSGLHVAVEADRFGPTWTAHAADARILARADKAGRMELAR